MGYSFEEYSRFSGLGVFLTPGPFQATFLMHTLYLRHN